MQPSKFVLYRVSRRPTDLAGLLATLIWGRAGDGAALDGAWFHFRKRKGFTKDRVCLATRSGLFDIRPIRVATEADWLYLESRVGLEWRWWRNCFCVTRRLFR